MIKQLIMAISAVILMISCVRVVRGKAVEKSVLLCVSIIYCICLFYFTMIRGARAGLSRVNFSIPLPFYRAIKAGHYGLTTKRSVLNVLLFVPFGYLMPQMISLIRGANKKLNWWMIILCGFLTSLLIEECQLIFHRGAFELDDLVKNTMGAAVGWLIWLLLNKIAIGEKETNDK